VTPVVVRLAVETDTPIRPMTSTYVITKASAFGPVSGCWPSTDS
jgi:hypothetical protein